MREALYEDGMLTQDLLRRSSLTIMDQAPLYEQFVLLGDSITEFGECHDGGFGFAAALRDGELREMNVGIFLTI